MNHQHDSAAGDDLRDLRAGLFRNGEYRISADGSMRWLKRFLVGMIEDLALPWRSATAPTWSWRRGREHRSDGAFREAMKTAQSDAVAA